MIYELTYGAYRLGTIPTEAAAVRRAWNHPKGHNTDRERKKDGKKSSY